MPSAIVLDVGLPDQSGLSVLDRLKRDVRTRHIPIHIVSADDYTETALSLGAVGYMLKPVQREQLVEVLHRVFGRARGQVQRARREARVLVESVEQMIRFREACPERKAQFVDVSYAALVADPLAVVRRIYQCWGRTLSPAAAVAMRALAASRSRYPKAQAALKPERHIPGLDQELRRLDGYCLRFGLQAR